MAEEEDKKNKIEADIKKLLEDVAPELVGNKEIQRVINNFVRDFSLEANRYLKKLSGLKFIKINGIWYEEDETYIDDESKCFKVKRVAGKLDLR